MIRTVTDTVFAGYVTDGAWRFRFVAADVPVQRCRSASNQNATAGVALKSNVVGQMAHIDLSCDGGPGSVRFGTTTHAEGAFGLSPRVGDVLRISIMRNRAASRDEFAATNTRSGRTQKVTVSVPGVIYRHAQVGATLVIQPLEQLPQLRRVAEGDRLNLQDIQSVRPRGR